MKPGRLPAALATLLLLAACASDPTPTPASACPTAAPSVDQAAAILADASRARVTTSKGEFTIELDASSAPIAVATFVALARCGYYDGITFHRVVAGFVAQAGDPQTRTNRGDFEGLGRGGPGFRFDIEFPDPSYRYGRHAVAMANGLDYDSAGTILGGTDTNGSQFFIALDDIPTLPPYYSVLGRVAAGSEVVDAIGQVPTSPRDLPLEPVIIERVLIEGAATES